MNFCRWLPIAASITILAGGCAFSRGTIGDDIAAEAVDSIKSGTTKAERVIRTVQDRVRERFGVDLRTEVRIVGEPEPSAR